MTKKQPDRFAKAKREREEKEKAYRERALKILPWVCARCGREFEGKRVRELTVHHKDHDHDNNPPDGSNWELLCIYCHDDEHARGLDPGQYGEEGPEKPTTYKPFANLGKMLRKPKKSI